MNNIHIYIGYIAGILGFIPYVLLIISMRKGRMKPNLAGWILYTIAVMMIVASSIALGAWQAVWLAMTYIVGQILVIAISFKTGYFSFSKFDYACFAVSLLGLILWIYTKNPIYALVLNVFVDAMGTLTIARKTWLNPGTEDTLAWTLSFLVAVLNIFAIASFDIGNALYPIYFVLAAALITILSLRKKN